MDQHIEVNQIFSCFFEKVKKTKLKVVKKFLFLETKYNQITNFTIFFPNFYLFDTFEKIKRLPLKGWTLKKLLLNIETIQRGNL